MQPGHQGFLLIRTHPGKDGSPDEQLLHDIRIVVPDDDEALSGDGEVVVVAAAAVAVVVVQAAVRLVDVDDERRILSEIVLK